MGELGRAYVIRGMGVGHGNVPIVEASMESVEHVLFKSASYHSQRGWFLGNAWNMFFTQATSKHNLAMGFSVNLYFI